MKKTIFTLFVCLACGLTYAEQATPVLTDEYRYIQVTESYPKINHLYIDKSENQQVFIELYNVENFTVDKQIKFSIPETNSEIYCQLIFDQFVMVETYDTTLSFRDNNYQTLKLYNTEGTVIYDFGKARELAAYVAAGSADGGDGYIWQIASNKLLFMVKRGLQLEEEWQYTNEYYTLTFESTESGAQNVQIEKKVAFPCPARGEVNIPTRGQQGDLRVLNLNGQTMDAQRIQEGDYQQVNTESYPAGTYIYQAGNETGKFMVE